VYGLHENIYWYLSIVIFCKILIWFASLCIKLIRVIWRHNSKETVNNDVLSRGYYESVNSSRVIVVRKNAVASRYNAALQRGDRVGPYMNGLRANYDWAGETKRTTNQPPQPRLARPLDAPVSKYSAPYTRRDSTHFTSARRETPPCNYAVRIRTYVRTDGRTRSASRRAGQWKVRRQDGMRLCRFSLTPFAPHFLFCAYPTCLPVETEPTIPLRRASSPSPVVKGKGAIAESLPCRVVSVYDETAR